MKIAQYLADSPWGDVTPETLDQGMGGRETAVVQLAEHWADMGHEVTTFAPVSKVTKYEHKNGGKSTYITPQATTGGIMALDPDVLITWEEPRIAADDKIKDSVGKIIMGMQVAHVVPDDVVTKALPNLDKIVCLSDYAADVLSKDNSKYISRDDIAIIPNCVDISLFPKKRPKKASVPRAIYSSSPDRGLQNLVHAWPMVLEQMPDAELHICYGVENWFKHSLYSHGRDGQHALEIRDFLGIDDELNQTLPPHEGVHYHGKVGQDELRGLMASAHLLAFPCETQSPTETGCITVVEALASYTHVVTGRCDCLTTEYADVATFVDLPVDHREYADALIAGFKGELPGQDSKVEQGRMLAEQRTWGEAARMYIELAEELVDAER